jgi:phage I-like protein
MGRKMFRDMRAIAELTDGNFSFFTTIDPARALSTDAAGRVWIQAAEVGEWFNPKYGEVPITRADLQRMFDNFKTGNYPPKPQSLPIDYEHLSVSPTRKAGDGVAGGWIHDLDLREDGAQLWALVEWTEPAKTKIRNKEYLGFSPLFHPNWIGHGRKELGVTLLGGALTNYQTIPGCVVTCSMDPTTAARSMPAKSFAVVSDLDLTERERRVREALSARFPLTMRNGEPDYASNVWGRYVFDDRVVFERGGKLWRLPYSFNDELAVTFDGEPVEVIVTDQAVSLSTQGTIMKLKNAQGQEVEIPATSFVGLGLDVLAAEIPAVKDLQSKVPAEGTRVVPATEFDTLNTQITTLSATVNRQHETITALSAENKANKVAAITARVDRVIAAGKLLPAEKEAFIELATANEGLFEKMIAAKESAPAPIVKLGTVHGADGHGARPSVVVEFDNLVTAAMTKDPKLQYAEAVKLVAKDNRDLATAMREAESVFVGPGGVALAAVAQQ